MEITEMLLTINENVDEVHEAGYSKGETAGYEAGKKAEYDAFWDVYQNNGNRTDYSFAFAGNTNSYYAKGGWTNETFKPKYPLIAPNGANYMFRGSCIENVDCDIDISQCTTVSYMFYYSVSLKTIRKLIISENVKMTAPFEQCSALENITFEGVIGQDIDFKSCTKLSKASIESIINHLSDTASGKTLTLSKTAVETAFEVYPADYDGDGKTDAWIGNGEEEWYELITPKSNWDIVAV